MLCFDVVLWCCVLMLCFDVVLWCLCCDVVCEMLCVMVWLVVNVVVRWNEWFYAVWGFCWQTDRQTDEQTLVVVESLSRLKMSRNWDQKCYPYVINMLLLNLPFIFMLWLKMNPQVSFLCCFIITIFTIYCFSFKNRLYMSLQMSSLCSLVFTMLTLIFNPFMCCSNVLI